MSCYFRHLEEVFDEAGVDPAALGKKRVDQAIHRIMGVGYKDCPATWKAIKKQVLGDDGKRREFVEELRNAVL